MVRPVSRVPGSTTIYDALALMRRTSSHLVLVEEDDVVVGVVTMADLLVRIFPHTRTA